MQLFQLFHGAHQFRRWPLVLCAAVIALSEVSAAPPAIEGYSDFAAFSRQVQALAKPGICTISSLAKSPGGREVWLATIGTGEADRKPAVLVVGNVHAADLVGSEISLRMAKRLIEAADEEQTKPLLERYTFYFIPRPNPDGSEAFFRAPLHERAGNDRRTDDDRDFEIGEDPPDDLNGDGLITMMRVEDPAGKYMPHPDDERVLIEADAKKNESGRYSLYIEGKDDDGDEQFNEDGSGGVSFNRNWTFKYPYFKVAAGPNQVSEPETRGVADFAFDHTNIAVVLCFSPEENLMHLWKPAENQGRIKTAILKEDAAHVEYVAEQYRKILAAKDAPASAPGEGSFSQWAYFHYGRWSFATRGWWIPKVEAEKKPETDKQSDQKESGDKDGAKPGEAAKGAEKKKAEGKPTEKKSEAREAEQVNALRWFDREKIDGFVPWKAIEHPGFPGKKVEVGGFKPFVLLNPPAKEIDALADKHVKFVRELVGLLPRLELADVKVEPQGAGVHRISCEVINSGYLPTMSDMGKTSGAAYPLQIELQLPEGTKFLKGTPRSEVDRLAGRGGKAEVAWLVRTADAKPANGTIAVYAPAVGRTELAIELKASSD
jgi:hypothetical protein